MNYFESFQRVLLLLVTFCVSDLPDMSISYSGGDLFRFKLHDERSLTMCLCHGRWMLFFSPLSMVLIFMTLVLILPLALEYDAFRVMECFPRL